MFRTLALAALFLCSFSISAQNNMVDKVLKYRENKLIKINDNDINKSLFFKNYKKQLGLSNDDSINYSKEITTPDGLLRTKYNQYYKGIEVVGGKLSLHGKNSIIKKVSSNLMPFIDIQETPQLSFTQIKDNIPDQLKASMKELEYLFNLDDLEVFYKKNGLRIIDENYPDFSGNYKLAYYVIAESYNSKTPFKEEIYIDANTGRLINHFSMIHVHQVPGTVKTKYYGDKSVTIDSIESDKYLLQDLSRGDGVLTLNGDLEIYSHNSKFWDLENENGDEVAGDLHYCSTSFYDMMKDRFNWDGIDGEGGSLIGVTHAGGKFLVNAYWDGTRARFGNGDCDRYTPLTTLTIVGHEFGHGFTDYTSNLIYRAESGALNESMSDIFGKALEYYYDNDNFNWKIGDRIRRNDDVNLIRSMEDPGVRDDPKYYKGENWHTSSGDNYGVHSNSGVLNHWFYLLVSGGKGVNEVGDNYDIESIGMDAAIQIAFTMQAAYLNENSNYFDALYASLESAEDIFGAESFEKEMVLNAWNAVGLFADENRVFLTMEMENENIEACPNDVVYPSLKLFNVGRNTVVEGTQLQMRFYTQDFDDIKETFIVENDIIVGDSIVYTFNTPITNTEANSGRFNIEISLISNPENVINAIDGTFATSDINGHDISLEDISIFKRISCKIGDVDAFRYRIRNEGCKTLPKNDSIYFDVETNAGDFLVGIKLFSDIRSGVISSSTRTLSFSAITPVPEGIEDYTVTLRSNKDINSENNKVSGSVENQSFIVNGYSEAFNNLNSEELYSIGSNTFYTKDTIVNYRNNNMLAIYGLRDHEFFRNCEIEDDFFNEFFFKADVEYCVDATDMVSPIFEFNAMMFTYTEGIAELVNKDYSTMIKVVYEDGQGDLILGQPDGSLLNHKLNLPSDYVGKLEISVLALSQNESSIDIDFTKGKDLVLLDDIKLYDSSTYNPFVIDGGYNIYPNPTSDIIRIANKDNTQVFDIEIFNALGQLIYQKENILNQDWVDISSQSQGIYLVNFMELGEKVASSKIIKVD